MQIAATDIAPPGIYRGVTPVTLPKPLTSNCHRLPGWKLRNSSSLRGVYS